jgi:hypothetical protein
MLDSILDLNRKPIINKRSRRKPTSIGSGVVLAECILRPLATASKSTQTDLILYYVKSIKDKEKKNLALKRLAFSKKFSIEQEANEPVICKLRYHCKKGGAGHIANWYSYK